MNWDPSSMSTRRMYALKKEVGKRQDKKGDIFTITKPRKRTWPPNWDPRDPLLVTVYIHKTKVHRVYIDNGSNTNVLYEHCFRKMPTSWKEGLNPLIGGLVVGFIGHSLWALGTIYLLLTLVSHDGKDKITQTIGFSMVRFLKEHNILLKRPMIYQLQGILLTIHGIVKFITHIRSDTIVSTNPRIHHYHQIIVAPELVRALKKSKEGCHSEKHIIHQDYPQKTVRIGANLSKKLKQG